MAPGLLNCASKAARFAVGLTADGGAAAAAAGTGTGVEIGGGKPANGGGWKGAGAGTEDDCAGEETRFRRSARLKVAGGCGVFCIGGPKPASSWAMFGGALAGGAPAGGKLGGMPCEGNPGTAVGGAKMDIGAGVGASDRT